MAKAAAAVENGIEKKRLALIAQSEDLGEARKALESAANIARGLWFTFMTLAVYLVIAVGSVTHRDLFLQTPVRLPLLNADLPLVAFFWVAPLMFLVFHGYLLLNLKFLGDNVRHYFRLVDETKLDASAKETLFLQLPNFLMVQLLRERRTTPWTLMGHALHGVAILTVVVGPIAVLLFLQMRFLPYHELSVTMLQRLTIAADLVLILYFWPGIVGTPASRRVWAYRLFMYGVMFAIVLFSGFVATFPGERNYGSAMVKRSGMADFLLRGPYNEVTGDRQSWFSDTLSLSDEDFVDKTEGTDVTVSLRGRDLSEANLARADLRKADFSGANLTRANFRGARLQEAIFIKPNASLIGEKKSVTETTNLTGADFSNAKLDKASFNDADLQGATFDSAELQNAAFVRSLLNGVKFVNAKMAGTNFSFSKMRGAYFKSSDLAGSQFVNSDLAGTVFVSSQLQQSRFAGARLDAAALVSTNVFGLQEIKEVPDTWLELSKARSSAAGVDWKTTLVHALKSEDRPLLVNTEDASFRVAGLESSPDGKPPADGDPALKAGELERKSVKMSQGGVTDADRLLWRARTMRLVALICLDADFGDEIYARSSQILGSDNKPLPLFGPFTSTGASVLLSDPECQSVLKPKQAVEEDTTRKNLEQWATEQIDPGFLSELLDMLQTAREAAKSKLSAAAQKGGLSEE